MRSLHRHPRSSTRGLVLRPLLVGIALALLLGLLVVLSVGRGFDTDIALGKSLRGVLALVGLAEPLGGNGQLIVELRILRVLTAVGVGAALSLSGALLQGLYRNDLASPGILGISAGASLGASLAILVLGGYGPHFLTALAGDSTTVFVSVSAFVCAMATAFLVTTIATSDGRVSVPTLLLVGIAVNAALGGALAAVQSFVLTDISVARAVFAWGFGSLDSANELQLGLLLATVALSALAIPFLGMELDLFAGGEDDARALGVDTRRVKIVALVVASLTAALAVSTAGQIGFVGLIVPHVLRLGVSRSHRVLLPLCLLGGPVFLLGTDLAQRLLLGQALFPPGVLMSLFGGPFFLFLLLRNRRRIQSW